MSQASSIQWTDFTWNPVRGCSRVSEGCRNCYAESIAARFSGPGKPFDGFAKRVSGEARWTGEVQLVPHLLDWPLRTRKSAEKFAAKYGQRPKVFVNSMSDLFHEKLSDDAIAAVYRVMAEAAWYVFQVLTKRPERAEKLLNGGFRYFYPTGCGCLCHDIEGDTNIEGGCKRCWRVHQWPVPNVWLGTSVEDQATADTRIPELLKCPAAVRFVSYEPALGPVHFGRWLNRDGMPGHCYDIDGNAWHEPGTCKQAHDCCREALDLVIVGGESGRNARPFEVAWARSVIEQCREAGAACFVKQLGARPTSSASACAVDCGCGLHHGFRHSHGGDPDEWDPALRVRQLPADAAGAP